MAVGATEEGVATYYSSSLAGHRTASGDRYDPAQLTAAHRTWPFGTRVRVIRLGTGPLRSVVVRVNDRGPFGGGRIIDLSLAAARQLDMLGPGKIRVRLEVVQRRSNL